MKFTTTTEINASADAVWDLMGERFADVGKWADAVTHSYLEGELKTGAIRTCELKPTPAASGTIKERLTVFDPAQKKFGYDVIDGLPGFMRLVNNTWTITPVGPNRARVTSTITMEVAWWMRPMLPMMRGQFQKTIRSFFPDIENAAQGFRPKVEPVAVAG